MTYSIKKAGYTFYVFAYGLPFVVVMIDFALTVLFLDHQQVPNDPNGEYLNHKKVIYCVMCSNFEMELLYVMHKNFRYLLRVIIPSKIYMLASRTVFSLGFYSSGWTSSGL